MIVTLKMDATISTEFPNYLELIKQCPYIHDGRMIGSLRCIYCEYCKSSDFDALTISCSYDYDHLTKEEQRSIYENL